MSELLEEVPQNPGGSLQLAMEGAARWWRDFGRGELAKRYGDDVAEQDEVRIAAMVGFLCGRLEIDKAARWEKTQQQIEQGRRAGHIIVPGQVDPTEGVV